MAPIWKTSTVWSFYAGYSMMILYLINSVYCSYRQITNEIKSVELVDEMDSLDSMWDDPFDIPDSPKKEDPFDLFGKPSVNYENYKIKNHQGKDILNKEKYVDMSNDVYNYNEQDLYTPVNYDKYKIHQHVDIDSKAVVDMSNNPFEGNDEDQQKFSPYSYKENSNPKVEPYFTYTGGPSDNNNPFVNFKINFNDSIWEQTTNLMKRGIKYFAKQYGFEGFVALCMVTIWISTFYTTFITGSYRVPIINILMLIFFGGYGVTWIRLTKQAEVKILVQRMKYPFGAPQCTNDLPWYTDLYYYLFAESCAEHLEKVMTPAWIKVTPLDVFSETWSTMVLYPAKNLGQAYANFISAATDNVPWYIKPFIIVITLFGPMIMIFGLSFLYMGYSFSTSFSPLTGFSLSFTSQQKNELKESSDNCKCKYIEEISKEKKKSKKDEILSIKDKSVEEKKVKIVKDDANKKKDKGKSDKLKTNVSVEKNILDKKNKSIETIGNELNTKLENIETIRNKSIEEIKTEETVREELTEKTKINRNDLCKKQEESQTDRIEPETSEESKYVDIKKYECDQKKPLK